MGYLATTFKKTCTAVGYYENSPPAEDRLTLAESWNGTEWKLQSSPNEAANFNVLYGVSCPFEEQCRAVGEDNLGGVNHTLVERHE
jgi:hypothetical protein